MAVHGFTQSNCNFGQIDNLAYTYAAGTNRLSSVADASGKIEGFKPGSGAGYTYDVSIRPTPSSPA